jgi:GWxTD domain-containing protein
VKKLFVISLCSFLIIIKLLAVDVSISHAGFKGEKENYIEFYFYVVGSTLKQIQIDSIHSQGSLEVTTLFKVNNEVKKFDKFILKSPPTLSPVNFYEMRRYGLENAVYDIEVRFKDVNNPQDSAVYKSMVIIEFSNLSLRQSDITLLNSFRPDSSSNKFTKNGYLMEVLPFQYYDRSNTNLIFYNELYNTDQFIGEDFLLSYAIEKSSLTENGKLMSIAHKRKKPAPFIANLLSLDISNLESGNYRLKVSVRNRNNDLLSEKETFFQRSNPLLSNSVDTITEDALSKEFVSQLSPQELRYALKAIAMNVPLDETSIFTTMMSASDTTAKRRFLFRYWAKKNPNLPEQAYDEYMMVAKVADKTYGNGYGYGFETDRGRIFMKYGRPDDVVTVENEANAPPYEVWVYYKFEKTQQTNVKFLFYNPNLIANGYTLLHSSCRGEIQNPRWKHELYKNVPGDLIGNSIDGRDVKENFNRRAEQIFNDN